MKALPVLQSLCCGPDVTPLDRDAAEDLAGYFKALADPTRVAIVSRLAAGECCVCDLNAAFELSQPAEALRMNATGELQRGRAGAQRKLSHLVAAWAGSLLDDTVSVAALPLPWRAVGQCFVLAITSHGTAGAAGTRPVRPPFLHR